MVDGVGHSEDNYNRVSWWTMTRKFCDICESPVSKEHPIKLILPIGEKYNGVRALSGSMPATGIALQCKIVVTTEFSFIDHKNGFGGPPDLCQSCQADLIRKLADIYERAI